MSIMEIVLVIAAAITIVGSITTVVWTLSNRPTYKYCDVTYKRIDVDKKDNALLISKIDNLAEKIVELKEIVESIKNGN